MFKVIVNDVSGNEAAIDVFRNKSYTAIHNSGIVAIIILGIVFVMAMLIGLLYYMRQHHKKYGSYQFRTKAVHPSSIRKSDAVYRHIRIDKSRTFVCCSS